MSQTSQSVPVFCVYGQQHVDGIRDILIPALAAQRLPTGHSLSLHLLNYKDNQALLGNAGQPDLPVTDWSATRQPLHIGFGEGVNYLFSKSSPSTCFFLVNPDSFPVGNCLAQLHKRFSSEISAGIVESRQWPSEHPKEYDPKTLETPWASGAFSLISAKAFSMVGGFDPVFFLYNEDVDISWQMWLSGWRIIYEPDAVNYHFTGLLSYRSDRYYHEHFFSSRNFLAIAYKFFGAEGEARAISYFNETNYPSPFKELVLSGYNSIKHSIKSWSGGITSPNVKITGHNTYHETRFP